MSFSTDFSSIVGTVGDTFKNVWSAINTPTSIKAPGSGLQGPTAASPSGSGVGSALKQATPTTSTTTIITYVALGGALLILVVVLILVPGRRR